MTVTPLRVAAVGLLALCAVPFIVPTESHGQPPAGGNHGEVVFAECFQCHYKGPNPLQKQSGADKLLRLTESSIWYEQDLHAKAVESLKGDLGKRMGELLYHDSDVTKQPDCLACHAVDLSLGQADRVAGHGQSVSDFFRDNGVSCEACHGVATQGNNEKEWLKQHRQAAWRKMLPAEKAAKGLIDMRSPEARTERCAACHVGNSAEGKFVTHAMFAAGHPPLPPLETLTYSHDQPSHAIPADKNKYIAEDVTPDDAWKLFHVRKDESSAARQAAVGAAVGFREAMKTLEHEADVASKKGQMLDFALFDCSACHHDLIVPSLRQGGLGTPGRPLPRTGPMALLRTVAGPESNGFDAKLAALVKSCDAKPFGDPAAIAPAARDLATWSDGLAKKLDDAHYDAAKTTQLRRDLADTARRKPGPGERGLDYDNAQQLLWAIDALRDEGTVVSPEVVEELAKLAGLPESDTPMLGRLWQDKKWDAGKRPLIVDTLSQRLGRVSRYQQDPETFRRAFEKIAAGLGTAGR
jgi:hypothetical protein